jgi:hypothetical protein
MHTSRDISVGTAKGYELDGRGSVQDRGKRLPFSSVEAGSETHPASYPMGSFPGDKATGEYGGQ